MQEIIPSLPNDIAKLIIKLLNDRSSNFLAVSKTARIATTEWSFQTRNVNRLQKQLGFWEQHKAYPINPFVTCIKNHAQSSIADFNETYRCLKLLSHIRNVNTRNTAELPVFQLTILAMLLQNFMTQQKSEERFAIRPSHFVEDMQNASNNFQLEFFCFAVNISIMDQRISAILDWALQKKVFSSTVLEDFLKCRIGVDVRHAGLIASFVGQISEKVAMDVVLRLKKFHNQSPNQSVLSSLKKILQQRSWSTESLDALLESYLEDLKSMNAQSDWVVSLLNHLNADQLNCFLDAITDSYLGFFVANHVIKTKLVSAIQSIGLLTPEKMDDLFKKLLDSMKTYPSQQTIELLYGVFPSWQKAHIDQLKKHIETNPKDALTCLKSAMTTLQSKPELLETLSTPQHEQVFSLACRFLGNSVRPEYQIALRFATQFLPVLKDEQRPVILEHISVEHLFGTPFSEDVQDFFVQLFEHYPEYGDLFYQVYARCFKKENLEHHRESARKMLSRLGACSQACLSDWSGVVHGLYEVVKNGKKPEVRMVALEALLVLSERGFTNGSSIEVFCSASNASEELHSEQIILLNALFPKLPPEYQDKYFESFLKQKMDIYVRLKTLSSVVRERLDSAAYSSAIHLRVAEYLNFIFYQIAKADENHRQDIYQSFHNALAGRTQPTQPFLNFANFHDLWYLMSLIGRNSKLDEKFTKKMCSIWLGIVGARSSMGGEFLLKNIYPNRQIIPEHAWHYFDVIIAIPQWFWHPLLIKNVSELVGLLDISRIERLASEMQTALVSKAGMFRMSHRACLVALLKHQDLPRSWVSSILSRALDCEPSIGNSNVVRFLCVLVPAISTNEISQVCGFITKHTTSTDGCIIPLLATLLKHKHFPAQELEALLTFFIEVLQSEITHGDAVLWACLGELCPHLNDAQRNRLLVNLPEMFKTNARDEACLNFFCRLIKTSPPSTLKVFQERTFEYQNPIWSLALNMLESWVTIIIADDSIEAKFANLSLGR